MYGQSAGLASACTRRYAVQIVVTEARFERFRTFIRCPGFFTLYWVRSTRFQVFLPCCIHLLAPQLIQSALQPANNSKQEPELYSMFSTWAPVMIQMTRLTSIRSIQPDARHAWLYLRHLSEGSRRRGDDVVTKLFDNVEKLGIHTAVRLWWCSIISRNGAVRRHGA